MTECTAERVGRISHGVFESRDLARTAAFFERYCELEPIRNADVAADILALRLASGARLVFHTRERTGRAHDRHGFARCAYRAVAPRSSYFPNYRRL